MRKTWLFGGEKDEREKQLKLFMQEREGGNWHAVPPERGKKIREDDGDSEKPL